MKKLVMLTLVVAGVLSISACEEEVVSPSNQSYTQLPTDDEDTSDDEDLGIKGFPVSVK